ncbi:MAG TPA: cyclic nucleotide-binding domain-containing protein [Terriglobia bacterium]|nr:cyclic nucleotide-binding domain-containing protein [Terriglobia bacterium]
MEKDIEALVSEHPFFANMPQTYRSLIAGCGRNTFFEADALIARTGDRSDWFYAIRHGRASVEIHAPGRGPIIIQMLEPGEIVGWSWLVEPYQWRFDVRAVEPVRAIAFDGACLRGKCDRDPVMGYDFMKRFAQVFVERLEAARLQLLDLYGSPAR